MRQSSMTSMPQPFLGLAPFLRLSIAGPELLPLGQKMLADMDPESDDANMWMNLSTVMLCLGQRELGLEIQKQALALQRIYPLPASRQPARFKLLMLMAPGDLAANTPLDCLLEGCDIDLVFYYLTPGNPLAQPIPEHDALIVGLGEDETNQAFLATLKPVLASWPKPLINTPRSIHNTGRAAASRLLQNIPGLLMPTTQQFSRTQLLAVCTGNTALTAIFTGCDFPIIVRPVGSQAGRDLARIASQNEMTAYFASVAGEQFFVAPFIDYSSNDGRFRKFRVALIDGQPYACHMAVSNDWMVHYVNAGMYEDPARRAEEADFMENFAAFAQRHELALREIHERTQLDYFCLDGAETRDGQLLIFEIDHVMVVHAMDPVELFPYKQLHMHKVQNAFRDYLLRLLPATEQR